MSIPALLISMNALEISEQQRTDALAQRAEDKREKERAKAEEEANARTAFIRNFDVSGGPSVGGAHYNIRNANPRRAQLWVRATSSDLAEGTYIYSVMIDACSEASVTVPIPFSPGPSRSNSYDPRQKVRLAVAEGRSVDVRDLKSSVGVWDLSDGNKPISLSQWAGGELPLILGDPTNVRKDILPCT
ncbi:hypothetical protein AB0K05_07450 [Nonomuraea sp. NPDC049486]|uniref:hypothetical protein n=1 Tax=Nonomuraea sp. NPDC049486 TaxID=3155773 RepID=UPI00343B1E3B